jgi:hypothetical protein
MGRSVEHSSEIHEEKVNLLPACAHIYARSAPTFPVVTVPFIYPSCSEDVPAENQRHYLFFHLRPKAVNGAPPEPAQPADYVPQDRARKPGVPLGKGALLAALVHGHLEGSMIGTFLVDVHPYTRERWANGCLGWTLQNRNGPSPEGAVSTLLL